MLRSRSGKFWEGRGWSGNFERVGVRVRHFTSDSATLDAILEMMASISLATVVQSNFCDRDFLTDHKFSMGLRSGEFPGQTITFNFAS